MKVRNSSVTMAAPVNLLKIVLVILTVTLLRKQLQNPLNQLVPELLSNQENIIFRFYISTGIKITHINAIAYGVLSTLNHIKIMVNLSHELSKGLDNTIMIKLKRTFLALFFLLPLNALSKPLDPIKSSELTNVIAIKGTIAGVVWDLQMPLFSVGGISDPNPTDNKFYAPTVLFFNRANGKIIKKMTFFSDACPYSPVSLTATETTITMITQILPVRTTNSSVGGSTPSSYSTCPYTESVTTLQETRNLKTGALIKAIELGNYRTADEYPTILYNPQKGPV